MGQQCKFWLTGGVATVLAAASQLRGTHAGSHESRRSPFTLQETVERLERQARRRGLQVFARLAPQPEPDAPGAAMLLVLGIDATQTPVLQTTADAGLELPLAMHVEWRTDCATEVQFSDSQWLAEHAELPRELMDQVAVLPALVSEALE